MTHTPGPWRVHTEVPNRILLNGSHSYEVECRTGDEPTYDAADVRLMAAAPELLAALIKMRDEFCGSAECKAQDDAWAFAQQVIEKAGGE